MQLGQDNRNPYTLSELYQSHTWWPIVEMTPKISYGWIAGISDPQPRNWWKLCPTCDGTGSAV